MCGVNKHLECTRSSRSPPGSSDVSGDRQPRRCSHGEVGPEKVPCGQSDGGYFFSSVAFSSSFIISASSVFSKTWISAQATLGVCG